MSEILDDFNTKKSEPQRKKDGPIFKTRNPFITIWLFLTIASCLWVALLQLAPVFLKSGLNKFEIGIGLAIGILSLIKVYFIYRIFWWEKIGFYGFAIASMFIFGINIFLMSFFNAMVIPIMVMIHYIILQMKNSKGVPAWHHFE